MTFAVHRAHIVCGCVGLLFGNTYSALQGKSFPLWGVIVVALVFAVCLPVMAGKLRKSPSD
jgi:hypothetical protein